MDVDIRCPICSESGKIEVSKKELGKASRGLLSISLPENVVCKHSFVAYIDKNFKVRDYFVPDFEINFRELGPISSIEQEKTEKQEESILPGLPANCKSGDMIEQEYKNDTLLSYIFSLEKTKGAQELVSFSILLRKNQNMELYKLVIQEFIKILKKNKLLNEKTLKTNQKSVFKCLNDESDLDLDYIYIPFSKIFKEKKKELKRIRQRDMKGSFF